MKLIIAGSRNVTITLEDIDRVIRGAKNPITEIVSGGARGPDTTAIAWARREGMQHVVFNPGWKQHGRAAGGVRNLKMANYADALVAFWNGRSNGTRNMIEHMRALGKPTHVVKC